MSAKNEINCGNLRILFSVSGGSRHFEKGVKDIVSASSPCIANVNNQLYAFYTKKVRSLKQILGE